MNPPRTLAPVAGPAPLPSPSLAAAAPKIESAPPMSGPPPLPDSTPPDPPVVMIAGPPDSGKTSDLGYAFPTYLWIASPGACEPLRATVGYDPDKAGQRVVAQTIKEVINFVSQARDAGYDGVVIDEFSYILHHTHGLHDASPEAQVWNAKEGVFKHNGFYAPGATRDELMELRAAARFAGIGVAVNSWLQDPKTKDGVFTPGGPQVPTRGMVAIMPELADWIARCSKNPARQPWPGTYIVDPLDRNYITKNRYRKLAREVPMNLGEILRYFGYALPRHPGLPWQEEVVDTIARELWAAGGAEDARIGGAWFDRLVERGVSLKHARWTLRDATDRVVLWRTAPDVTAAAIKASFGWR